MRKAHAVRCRYPGCIRVRPKRARRWCAMHRRIVMAAQVKAWKMNHQRETLEHNVKFRERHRERLRTYNRRYKRAWRARRKEGK